MSPSEPRSGLSGGSAQSAPPHYMVLFRKFARWRRPGCPNGREPHPITACLGCHGGFVGRARPAARMRLRHDAASPSTQPNADSHHRRRYTATGALTPRHRRPLMASHFDPLSPSDSPALQAQFPRMPHMLCPLHLSRDPHAPHIPPTPTIPVSRALRMPRPLRPSACPARSACLVCSTYPRVPRAPHALPIPPISRTTHSSAEKSPYLLTFRPCGRKTALYVRPKAHCGEL